MGAWGTGSFENDAALDWLAALKRAAAGQAAPEFLRGGIEPFADPALGMIDADEAHGVIAACEVIAALLGCPGPTLPAPARDWLEAQDAALRDMARALQPTALATLSRVKTASELHELWIEGHHLPEFEAAIGELHERLRGASFRSRSE
jgi:hypothetical protein